ncbi:DUF6474 family protein [Nocardia sp. CNY236]|uniref:DUF6474 family protein n=1 Tax=Nocardia sp. CNY236 TaxID=1169152 RepID=UPI000417192D|nr:DUF6474 family protein [Nocardia sp. CNY236]
MGLFTKRKRRANRKAMAKALERKAVVEAKLVAKNDRKARRAETRTRRKVARAQVSAFKAEESAFKAEEKAALETAAKANRDRFSAGQVKKYLGVVRVLVPVLAPLAYRGATFLRGWLDARRARQLGIGVDRLGDFTGHGAKLDARIANAEAALTQVATQDGTGDTRTFITATEDRLSNLATAVRTADQMPGSRRRAVHTSISHELSGIEADILARLGVR